MTINDIIGKYPIVNNEWEVGDSVYGLDFYIQKISRDLPLRGYEFGYYYGLRDYFVRWSDMDSRNCDPWNRKFFAYKTGFQLNMSNQYMCRPLIVNSYDAKKNGYVPRMMVDEMVMMYVITTSVDGRRIHCLDVIKDSFFEMGIWPISNNL